MKIQEGLTQPCKLCEGIVCEDFLVDATYRFQRPVDVPLSRAEMIHEPIRRCAIRERILTERKVPPLPFSNNEEPPQAN